VVGLLMAYWIVFSVLTELWERVRPSGGMRANVLHRLGQVPRATVGLMVAILLALVPILAIPILFFTLAGLANGLADLLEDRLVARLRQH
jgi:hypothetical protein